uniref:Uncharacterized protein n=2 Tax=Tolypothrix TaxID=111782 RepID=A0A0C1RQ08_9CYAN
MFDRTCVVLTMQDLGYTSQADWLSEHLDDYLDILIVEYSRWMEENAPPPSESLAQKVARETGLELISE